MKVKLIPESCSKDLIEEIRTMRETLPVQEWIEYVIEGCSDEEFMDALYYACEKAMRCWKIRLVTSMNY